MRWGDALIVSGEHVDRGHQAAGATVDGTLGVDGRPQPSLGGQVVPGPPTGAWETDPLAARALLAAIAAYMRQPLRRS
jgi:hypothetical protein